MRKLILLLVFGILLISEAISSDFTPIFCNDYEFTCCNKELYSTESHSITEEISWICPFEAYECRILSSTRTHYVGSENCYLRSVWHGEYWGCDDGEKNKVNMQSGDYVYLEGSLLGAGEVSGTVEVEIYKEKLNFCGRAGCTQGISVSGADGCGFSPINGKVYTSTDSLTGVVNTNTYKVAMSSCVLAFQSGDRHICGYKEESCFSDSDCGMHTYGNKECVGRTLQTYGCRNFGTPINEEDRGPFESGWGTDAQKNDQNTFGKRCEIINSVQVQCCGDNDCGADYFCDKNTFTCKENVECYNDYDCGVSEQCDWTTNLLKKPLCRNGKCIFEEKKVGCCSDKNCREEEYCTEEHECKQSSSSQSSIAKSNSSITGSVIGIGINGKSLAIVGGIIAVIILAGIVIFLMKKKKGVAVQEGIKCKSCNAINEKGKKFCTNCGNKLVEVKKRGKKDRIKKKNKM